jgi:iron complex transport system ATP-binding protein
MTAPLIEYRDVTVQRGERVALDRVNLAIAAGEHVAILGPNGSGKSTLIKTITRELYPLARAGSFLRILGCDRWNIFDLRPLLGIVSNDLIQTCARHFYTGREIVLSGFFGSIGIWPNHEVTAEMERRADDLMDRLEIGHLAERNAEEMSSGEARRVVIARALVHDPKALVLDEPTNSLDFHAMHALRSALSRIAQSGTGLILVTHHLDDIVPEVTRIILLENGRVVGDGPKAQMLTAEHISRLFRTAVEVEERNGYYHLW